MYYCVKCEKNHKDGYHTHKKYMYTYPNQDFKLDKDNTVFEEVKLEKSTHDIVLVHGDMLSFLFELLEKWGWYMDRHVPGFRMDRDYTQKIKKWVNWD